MEKFEKAPAREKSPDAAKNKLSFFFLIVLAGAFFLRVWQLEIKPVHFDEGINGHFVASIWKNGFYRYDPTNFHGPLYFYILQLTELIFGFGIFGYRFVTGLIQLAALVIIAKHRRFVGKAASATALILALSTAFVFYSRYSIHESLFIFGQVAFSYGYFMYRAEKSTKSLWWMALSVVVLISTKETFFIFLGTWAIAVTIVNLIDKHMPALGSKAKKADLPAPPAAEWFSITAISVLILLALFTGFFVYPRGALDMFSALNVWTKTGTGPTGHEKPFFYYVELFKLYEWPILIGLIASPFVFFKANRPLRILTLVGFGTWLAYSLIPYKTPWLVLNPGWSLAFVSGALLGRAIPSFKWRGLRTGLSLTVLVAIIASLGTMWRLNFHDFAKGTEPYVYVQSTQDLKRGVDVLYKLLEKHPEARNIKISATNRDPWPLPYLLIPFTQVSWGHVSLGHLDKVDVLFVDYDDIGFVERNLRGRYFVLPFQIREAYQHGRAYLRAERFSDIVPASTLVFNGATSGGTP